MVLSSSQWWASSGDAPAFVPKGAIWFDGAADYLTKTFSSSALNTKGTYSFWMKRAQLSTATETFISVGSGAGAAANTWLNIRFQSGDDMWCNDYTTLRARTTQVFRDPAAWYHFVFRVDTTLTTPSSRFRIYVNGTEVTSYVTENDWSLDDQINLSGNGHPFLIGQWNSSEWFNGYISEFVFLDGYSAPPSDFGTEDSNGVWIPKDPTDTVTDNKGTNGFWLDFADSSDLGNDVSGNNHDFTATSMSSANWTYDRPADSGTDTGNQCTFNPIFKNNATNNPPTFSNGNLTATSSSGPKTAVTTIPIPTTGKWSCKVTKGALTSTYDWFNLMVSKASNFPQNSSSPHQGSDTLALVYSSAGGTVKIWEEGTEEVSITSWGTGTGNVEALVDRDANTIKWYMNGSRIQDGGSDYTTSIPSDLQGEDCYFTFYVEQADISITMNYTASDTDYSVALATQNLPEPSITDPGAYFGTLLWRGNGADDTTVRDGETIDGEAVTGALKDASGTRWTPDLALIKNRTTDSTSWVFTNSVRGVTNNISTDTNAVEDTATRTTEFLAGGIEVGASNWTNKDDSQHVGFFWQIGGAPTTDNISDSGSPGQTPTSGSVYIDGSASTAALESAGTYPVRMSVNTKTKMSLLTYKAGSATTIPHGLGVKPNCIFIKNLSSAKNWRVGFFDYDGPAITNDNFGFLDADSSAFNTSGNTDHLASGNVNTFSIDGDNGVSGNASWTHLAWVMSSVEGFSKIGTYMGNGSTDGPFVYTGHKSAWLMIKCESTTEDWKISNSAMSPYNPILTNGNLNANRDAAQDTPSNPIDYCSTGFKLRMDNNPWNQDGKVFTFISFAESPFASNNRAR